MNKTALVQQIKDFVKEEMSREATGHDWFHVERVYKMALLIAKNESNVDLFIIKAAALLHDIPDDKVDTSGRPEDVILTECLDRFTIDAADKEKITQIILNLSFRKNLTTKKKLSKEGQIVQDADRLEALGAIGIGRAFAYGGKKNREMYNPSVKPQTFTTIAAYRNANGTTVNHFYEKLFKLKAQLNTKTAKAIASKRERFMKDFLKEFYAEWNVKA